MDQKPRAAGALLLGIIAAFFCLYVIGYFALVEMIGVSDHVDDKARIYSNVWLARAYWPLAKMEGLVTG